MYQIKIFNPIKKSLRGNIVMVNHGKKKKSPFVNVEKVVVFLFHTMYKL